MSKVSSYQKLKSKVDDLTRELNIIKTLEDENKQLKMENEKLKQENDFTKTKLISVMKKCVEKDELQEQIDKLKKDNDELEQQIVKLKNDMEIVNMLYIDDVIRKEINTCIDEGEDQITIDCGNGFYKEHILNYISEYIIPALTEYENGDSDYNMYKNGYYYYDGDCYSQYEVVHNGDGTFCFNRVESEEESEEESDDDDE